MPKEEIPAEAMDEIMELIYSGQKIAACKRYMELHDRELDDIPSVLEAKNFIEELTAELRTNYPERFSKSESAGCGTACLAWAVLFGSAVWWTLYGA